jgi:predicted ATPase
MLDGLLVENFKCLKKKLVPLSSLTLMTGFNAAGKSTAIQSILLGSQMARSGGDCRGVPLNGELVKLGTTGDVLCQYADEPEIRFTYTTLDEDAILKLDASISSQTSLAMAPGSSLKDSKEILHILRNTIHISATRSGTLDVFPSPDDISPIFADVGECGQFAPWWFDKYCDDDIPAEKMHPDEKSAVLRRQFIAWANEIFPGSEANTESIDRTPLVRLELRIGLQDQWKRPANIGYGLTYVFPILVAGLLAKKGQVLIIDSPEAHLHPMGQSKIGYFLAVIAAAGVQVIIETHSDHILNGVRLAVSKNSILNSEVAIHFFSPSQSVSDNSPTVISPLIDRRGNLSEWPDGFFDQSDKDLSTLSGWD